MVMEMQIVMVVADAVMMATIRKVILKGMFVTVATIKMLYAYGTHHFCRRTPSETMTSTQVRGSQVFAILRVVVH